MYFIVKVIVFIYLFKKLVFNILNITIDFCYSAF